MIAMAAKDAEQVLDVQSVVEAVVANEDADVPSYEVESLCMRCGENVLALFLLFNFSQFSSSQLQNSVSVSAAFSSLIRILICDCLVFS